MTTGEKIRTLRKELGLTQKQLAEKSGIIETTIRKYESGAQNPKLNNLQKLATAFDIPLNDLLFPDGIDREFEMICDTLSAAGYKIEQEIMADRYCVAPVEDPEAGVEIEYSDLVELCRVIITDAERKKNEYIQKRLAADLFGWKF